MRIIFLKNRFCIYAQYYFLWSQSGALFFLALLLALNRVDKTYCILSWLWITLFKQTNKKIEVQEKRLKEIALATPIFSFVEHANDEAKNGDPAPSLPHLHPLSQTFQFSSYENREDMSSLALQLVKLIHK